MNQVIPDRIGLASATAQAQRGEEHKGSPPTAGRGLRHTHYVSMSRDDEAWIGGFLKPLHDRVLVQRVEAPSASPIIVPEVARAKPLRGIVLAVGPGKKGSDGVFRETMVRPGDEVLFTASVDVPYADLVHDGDLVMMSEADILGILPKSLLRLRKLASHGKPGQARTGHTAKSAKIETRKPQEGV